MSRPLLFGRLALLAMFALAGQAVAARPDARALLSEADALRARGQFSEAIKIGEQAADRFAGAKDDAGEYTALLGQIAACQALGQHKLALVKLVRAEALAGNDPARRARTKGTRGALSLFAREAGDAEQLLTDSAKLARTAKDDAVLATARFNLGVLFTGQRKFSEAKAALDEALKIARRQNNLVLVARTHKAQAEAAQAAGEFAQAETLAGDLAKDAAALPDGHEKAFLLMAAGQMLDDLFRAAPAHDNRLRARAFALHQEAAAVAERTEDPVALSFALGYQGGLYEYEKKRDAALALSRRALALAQQAQAPDSVYRWQWQIARILAAEGQRDPAIDGYRRAVATLQTIRNDLAIRYGNRNAGSSFREAVGAIYFELADLLLQRAESVADDTEKQTLLREARSTSELLKSAELEDYFQDDCVNLRRELTKNVENLDPKAAVVYIIPLPNRTEILVSLPAAPAAQGAPPNVGRIERFKAEPNDDALMETVRQFRLNLEDRTTYAYLLQAQKLYQWLIKPIEPLLAEKKFETLVFVPDGAMRTIPMAALYDGEKFLIEKYAVAITPGLELMEAKKGEEVVTRMLVSGLTDSVQGFPALPAVSAELDNVSKLYNSGDAGTLRNKAFSTEAVSKKLSTEEFTIVHLATHGVFSRDVRKSFVLTHDNQLTLDDLERLIRPGQLREQPLDLLTLSACETAAGDDRAALGLAGIAVKAGARSAFASLWAVNDRASAMLIGDFYTELKKPGHGKAHALQVAQIRLLKDPTYSHPCYWSPYLMIGNWL